MEHDASPRHPEVRAQRASKGDGPERTSFEARQSRAPQDDGLAEERGGKARKKKQPRRDRTGGPRPKYPRQK